MEDCFDYKIKVLSPEESLKKRPALYASCLKGNDQEYKEWAKDLINKCLQSEDLETKKIAQDILEGKYDAN